MSLPLSRPTIQVAQSPLDAIAAVGDPVLEWRYPLGCWNASWTLGLKPLQQPPALYRDAPTIFRVGGVPVWSGDLDEPDYAETTFSARGACRSTEDALCLKSDNTTTTAPTTAVDQAISRGALTFKRNSGLSTAPHGDVEESAKLNTISSLLDSWSDEAGINWAVTPNRQIITSRDPTTPRWHIIPGATELGLASETLASRVIGLYATSNGRLHRLAVGSGRPEVAVDLTELGAITAARATTILNRIRAKAGPAAGGWSNTIEVTANQITTPGGVHPHLAAVGASVCWGVMVRLLGHPDPRTDDRTYAGRQYTDVIIEAAEWNVGEGKLTLTPRGYADRDLSSIIESAGGALAS